VRDTQTRQESTPCCHSYFWLNNDAHLQSLASLAQKARELWKKPNCNDQTFHAKARLTGHGLFSHFGRVFLSLSKGRQEGLTPWPCHLHSKVSQSKTRLMETQIFYHTKYNLQKILYKKPKCFQIL
jgi:hypothetical protein